MCALRAVQPKEGHSRDAKKRAKLGVLGGFQGGDDAVF